MLPLNSWLFAIKMGHKARIWTQIVSAQKAGGNLPTCPRCTQLAFFGLLGNQLSQ